MNGFKVRLTNVMTGDSIETYAVSPPEEGQPFVYAHGQTAPVVIAYSPITCIDGSTYILEVLDPRILANMPKG